jgi:hypothetical protein
MKDLEDFKANNCCPKRDSKFSLSLLPRRRCEEVSKPSHGYLFGVTLKLKGEFCSSLVCFFEMGDMFKFGMRDRDESGAKDRYSS